MKQMYNRIYRFYGRVESALDLKVEVIMLQKIAFLPDASGSTALEYACGSGLLSLKLAKYFKSVTSRDLSSGMLTRAQERAKRAGVVVDFSEGNILDISEQPKSYDYVFVSFALHLFAPDIQKGILAKLRSVARKAVIIIDHGRKWKLSAALVEWFEGGYYDKFIKQDFESIAREIGCRTFEEDQIEECTVMCFYQ
jgi:ubiquinone/menaquinone biosynthesis C-methylase UbiE